MTLLIDVHKLYEAYACISCGVCVCICGCLCVCVTVCLYCGQAFQLKCAQTIILYIQLNANTHWLHTHTTHTHRHHIHPHTHTHTHGNCYSINTTIKTEFGSVKIPLTKMFLGLWNLTAGTGWGSGRECDDVRRAQLMIYGVQRVNQTSRIVATVSNLTTSWG